MNETTRILRANKGGCVHDRYLVKTTVCAARSIKHGVNSHNVELLDAFGMLEKVAVKERVRSCGLLCPSQITGALI